MIDNLIRDFRILAKANSLIGRIWINVIARRLGLFAFAGLIAVFGLGMGNVAGFYALQPNLGAAWAAAVMALADLLLATIIMLLAWNVKPGPEIEIAFDVRKMAIASIETDARELRLTVDSLSQEIKRAKDTMAGFAHHPLDSAAEKLLIPAVLSIMRGLRGRKDQS